MAEELKEETPKIEEEKTNGKRTKSGSGTSRRRKSTGGNSGDEGRDSGGTGGQSGGEQGGDSTTGTESGDAGNERKRAILERLKGKRDQGTSGASSEKHNGTEGISTGIEWGDNRTPEGVESISGIDSGEVSGSVSTGGKPDVSDGDLDGDRKDSGSQTRKRKIKGVEFELPKFDNGKPTQPIDKKEQQLEKELTQKESKDLQPRVENSLRALFNGMDKAIDLTSKIRTTKVNIWGSIEDEEITIIATALLETGQKSKVVSTITRRMASDYLKLQIGIITLPRFIDTYQHYMKNGFGFGFSPQPQIQTSGGNA